MTRFLVALGANEPLPGADLVSALEGAVEALGALPGTRVERLSRWFDTPAWPPGAGPDFVNGAAAVVSNLESFQFLSALHEVEAGTGRVRGRRWAPRTCDLDLLAAGDQVLPDAGSVRRWMEMPDDEARHAVPDRLILPHPRLHQRAFVLVPLQDVAPTWRHPILGLTVGEMTAALPAAERDAVRPRG